MDTAKLRDYCLSPSHFRGRHKARVFQHVVGLAAEDADYLRDRLLLAARNSDAIKGDSDEYGQRYLIDFSLDGPSGTATVRSTWIMRTGEDFARFVTCYVL